MAIYEMNNAPIFCNRMANCCCSMECEIMQNIIKYNLYYSFSLLIIFLPMLFNYSYSKSSSCYYAFFVLIPILTIFPTDINTHPSYSS